MSAEWTPLYYREMDGPIPPPEGAPRFFKRWDARDTPLKQNRGGMIVITPTAGLRLLIYGYATTSHYQEDKWMRDQAWELRQNFEAACFSTQVPEQGEIGMVPLNEVEPISEEEFLAAYGRGWVE